MCRHDVYLIAGTFIVLCCHTMYITLCADSSVLAYDTVLYCIPGHSMPQLQATHGACTSTRRQGCPLQATDAAVDQNKVHTNATSTHLNEIDETPASQGPFASHKALKGVSGPGHSGVGPHSVALRTYASKGFLLRAHPRAAPVCPPRLPSCALPSGPMCG